MSITPCVHQISPEEAEELVLWLGQANGHTLHAPCVVTLTTRQGQLRHREDQLESQVAWITVSQREGLSPPCLEMCSWWYPVSRNVFLVVLHVSTILPNAPRTQAIS